MTDPEIERVLGYLRAERPGMVELLQQLALAAVCVFLILAYFAALAAAG